MTTVRATVAAMPMLARAATLGATAAGLVGAVAGLFIGLATYAPTAAFAVVELAVPATLAGAAGGLAIGSGILAVRRVNSRAVPSTSGKP